MLEAIRDRLRLDANDARAIVERLFRDHPTHRFAVRLWDGSEVAWGSEHDFTLVFADAETFRRCLVSHDVAQLAEAYVEGQLRIEGDLWAATSLASYLRRLAPAKAVLPLRERIQLVPKLVAPAPRHPASRHTVEEDRRDIRTHYDLSDDVFRLFLDDKMVYSCAYFQSPEQSLERAQERKLDLVCKKLRLRPGEMLLDVGCGWGALLIWAARHYGVFGYGITLSNNQLAEARHRVAEAGLADRIEIDLRHYTELGASTFDKISSIGMYEHVGRAKLPAYFGALKRALRPGGLVLNHGITRPPPTNGGSESGGAFIFRRVFPGAELVDVVEIQRQMQGLGFELLDVQALRPHYALTLREWFRRLVTRREEALRLVPERTLRMLEMYLAGCAHAFADGLVGIHQVLAAKPDGNGSSDAPLTRAETFLHDELSARGSA